jgi:hypothetical protein
VPAVVVPVAAAVVVVVPVAVPVVASVIPAASRTPSPIEVNTAASSVPVLGFR